MDRWFFLFPVRNDFGSTDHLSQLVGILKDIRLVILESIRESLQNPWKPRSPVLVFWRKIGTSKKRPQIGGQKYGQRPTPSLSHSLSYILVDLIQIRTFL